MLGLIGSILAFIKMAPFWELILCEIVLVAVGLVLLRCFPWLRVKCQFANANRVKIVASLLLGVVIVSYYFAKSSSSEILRERQSAKAPIPPAVQFSAPENRGTVVGLLITSNANFGSSPKEKVSETHSGQEDFEHEDNQD